MAVEWWSIEVLNGRTSAMAWRDAHQSALVESAITHGVLAWEWHTFNWGVVFEVAFADERRWESWYRLPGVRAALDAVPNPVSGLLVHRGRGGACGTCLPRRPRPSPAAAAVARPEPSPGRATRLVCTGTDLP